MAGYPSAAEQDDKRAIYELLMRGNVHEMDHSVLRERYPGYFEGSEKFEIRNYATRHCEQNLHDLMFESLSQNGAISCEEWILNGHCSCPLAEHDTSTIGVYPVHVAVRSENPLKVLDFLFSKGSDLSVQTLHNKYNVLYLYMMTHTDEETLDMAKFLVERSFYVLQVDKQDMTLLHTCIKYKHAETLKYLMECTNARCLLNTQNEKGRTPLKMAMHSNSATIIKYLLTYEAIDVNLADNTDETPLYAALQCGNKEMAHCIVDLPRYINVTKLPNNIHLLPPIHLAVRHVDPSLAEKMLKRGADPNVKTEVDHLTPIMFACYLAPEPDVVVLLIKYGADVNITNEQGYTALHSAAWDGHFELVKVLVEAGAAIDNKANDGNTPLSLACHGGQRAVVGYLLPFGCNVNNRDKDTDMPLHYATFNGSLETVKALCENGAEADAPNCFSTTPFWNACYIGNIYVAHYLLQYNPDVNVKSCGIEQHSSAMTGVQKCFQEPKSILFAAAKSCSKKKKLIDSGVDGQKDKDGRDLLRILIAVGAKTTGEHWIYEGVQHPWQEGIVDWLMNEVSQPLSLVRHCRACVRNSLRGHGNFKQLVNSLEIPNTLKRFLITHDM